MASALQAICQHCDTINRIPSERLRDGAKCGACHKQLFERKPIAPDNLARFDRHSYNSDIPLLIDF